jgi:hypothetical protein
LGPLPPLNSLIFPKGYSEWGRYVLAKDTWNEYKEELDRYRQEPKKYDEPR